MRAAGPCEGQDSVTDCFHCIIADDSAGWGH